MDWDKLRIFHAAAEAGSFTHAGDTLRMSQSAVSRQVSALEKDLRVALFHRHARGLVLTEQGDMLYRTASEILSKLATAETLLTDATTKPAGDLRVTAPTGLGTVWITNNSATGLTGRCTRTNHQDTALGSGCIDRIRTKPRSKHLPQLVGSDPLQCHCVVDYTLI